MDVKVLRIAWTLAWRCRTMIGLIRWSTGCRAACVVRHRWLLVCLPHLRSTVLQGNIDQESLTFWVTVIFGFWDETPKHEGISDYTFCSEFCEIFPIILFSDTGTICESTQSWLGHMLHINFFSQRFNKV